MALSGVISPLLLLVAMNIVMLFLTPTMACKKQVKKYNKGNLLSNLSYLTSSEGISDVNELPDSTSIMIVGGYDGNVSLLSKPEVSKEIS